MLQLKDIKTIVEQIAELRQLPVDLLWNVIETALGTAYKKEYGKLEQIIQSRINRETGEVQFFQVKKVLDNADILPEGEQVDRESEDERVHFNPEKHILLEDARLVNAGVQSGEELFFELEEKSDFGRIATQSARQALTQSIYNAERTVAIDEFKDKEHTLVHGQVQRIEKGNVFVDLGRTVAILPFSEQIRGERFKQGETIQAYIVSIDSKRKSGGFVLLSRTNPNFIVKLFEREVPELEEGILSVKKIVRDPGVRTKIAVDSKDPSVDPIGSFVGQRGVRIMTVKSELHREQIDVIPWTEDLTEFAGEAISPARVLEVSIEGDTAYVKVTDEQIPIAIGRGGQNLKLASKLIEKQITIVNQDQVKVATYPDENGELFIMVNESDAMGAMAEQVAPSDAANNSTAEGVNPEAESSVAETSSESEKVAAEEKPAEEEEKKEE